MPALNELIDRHEDPRLRRGFVVWIGILVLAVSAEWTAMALRDFKAMRAPELLPEPRPYAFDASPFTAHDGWGDLYTLARPRSERLFPTLETERHIEINESGHRGPDFSGDTEILIYGASSFDAGTTNADTFGARLQAESGKKVATRAWPGKGPEFGILHEPLRPAQVEQNKPLVVWAATARIVRAQYRSGGMRKVLGALGPKGEVLARSEPPSLRGKLRAAMGWPGRIESYLKARSPFSSFAREGRLWTVPATFDPCWGGWRFLTLGAPFPEGPMIIYEGSIAAAFDTPEQRGDAVVMDGFQRVHAYHQELGIRLVVLLVPDRFQMYHQELSPKPVGGTPTMISSHWAAKLRKAGINAIDLYPGLRDAQIANPNQLLFRRDDTHWNDRGIRVSAQITIRELRNLNLLPN